MWGAAQDRRFDDAAAARRADWRMAMFVVAMAILLAMMAFRTRDAFNPDSLWLDDQWVASLARHAAPGELLTLMPPAPIGFLLLMQGITRVFGAGHWQWQLVPMLCGFAQVPLLGWIAWRATGRVSLGVLAAALLSGSTTFLIYTWRIKQYTLEGFVALALIGLALACAQGSRKVPFALVVLAGLLAIPLSFTAVPVGMVVVNVLALHLFLTAEGRTYTPRAQPTRRHVVSCCTAYNVFVLGWLMLVQFHQANDVMHEFWARYYMPIHDLEAFLEFLRTHLSRFLTGGLPSLLGWLTWVVPIGMALLCWRRRWQPIALALLLFYGGMFTISAMHLYPLGARRTDIFSYPITILAIVAGIAAMSRYVRFLPQLVLLIVIGRMILFVPTSAIQYPGSDDRRTVEWLVRHAQPEDAIVIGPRSSWAIGCYTEWPVKLTPIAQSTNGFLVEPSRPHTIVLPDTDNFVREGSDASERARSLDPVLEHAPRRIWLISLHHLAPWVPAELESRSYAPRAEYAHGRSVRLFEREE